MMGKTHTSFGVAITSSCLLITNVKNKYEFISYILVAIIASLLPDIDSENSIIRNKIREYRFITIIFCALFFFMNNKYLKCNFLNYRTFVLFIMIGFLFYVSRSKHRYIAHSIFTSLFLSFLLFLILNYKIALIFFINYSLHIVLDLLNYTKVKILMPFNDKGFSLKLCKSNSIVNYILGLCSFSIALFNMYKLLL